MDEFIKKAEAVIGFILSGAVLNCIHEEAVAYSLLIVFAIMFIIHILKERVS